MTSFCVVLPNVLELKRGDFLNCDHALIKKQQYKQKENDLCYSRPTNQNADIV